MKQGWEIRKLGDVIQKTETIDPTKKPENEFKYVDVSSVNNRDFFIENSSILKGKDAPSRARKLIKTNDVIFATVRPTLKRIAIVEEDFNEQVCSTGYFVFRTKETLNNKLLFYYLLSDSFNSTMEKLQKGASYPAVTDSEVRNQLIPFPQSFNEQKLLVARLDEAFASIAKAKANAEQNLKNAKELFKSYLDSVFENKGAKWVKSTIGETCNLLTGGTPSRNNKEFFVDGNIKWLVSGDINKKIIYDCEGRITELGLKNSNARYLPVNSVLIALNGQGKTRGTVAMLKTKATCNQSLVALYPKIEKSLLPELIYANLEGRYDEIRRITGDSGNDRRGLNMPLIRKIKFSYPLDIEEQKRIIQDFEILHSHTKKMEVIYKQKLSVLEELKKSILQKAFSGEL